MRQIWESLKSRKAQAKPASLKTIKPLKLQTSSQRNLRLFAVALATFVFAFFISSVFAPVSPSKAQELTVTNQNVEYYVEVSSAHDATNPLALDITLSEGTGFATITDTVTTKTNSPTGYQLYLSMDNDDAGGNNLYYNGSSSSTETPIAAIDAPHSTPTTLTANTWGYTTTEENVNRKLYSGVNLKSAAERIATSSSATSAAGESNNVYYAVSVNDTLAGGNYSNTILYTAIAESPTPALYTMQDFTNAQCNSLPVSTAENPYHILLEDTRDGKQYKVSRLADNPTSGDGANNGICWMVQNLALNGTDASTGQARVLTSADSDVTTNRTLALDMTSGSSNATSVQIITSAQNNTTTSCNTSSYPDCIVSSEPYGNLYNWYAATATTGTSSMTSQDATDSVCPKGWKLPTNGGDGTLRSYGNLMSKSGMSATSATNHTYVQNVQKAPLYFPLSGHYNSGLTNQGRYGAYWSRTANSSSSYAYGLDFNSSNGDFFPQYVYTKSYGRAVRCVLADQRTLADINYMQDMTADICQNTTEGFATTLLDRRGKGNAGSDTTTGYGVVKAKDGNCWMTDNLNLYNKTISSTDSNLSSGSVTIPASSTWSSNENAAMKVHVADGTGSYADKTGTYYGQVYYNWCTAIANASVCNTTSTTNQDTSICPKGWMLPRAGTSESDTSTDKSWPKLINTYKALNGGTLTGADLTTTNTSAPAYPLGFRLYYGGWYYDRQSEYGQGLYGLFWSATTYSAAHARYFAYDSSGVRPYSGSTKGYGSSVRCVAQ